MQTKHWQNTTGWGVPHRLEKVLRIGQWSCLWSLKQLISTQLGERSQLQWQDHLEAPPEHDTLFSIVYMYTYHTGGDGMQLLRGVTGVVQITAYTDTIITAI